MTPEVLIHFTTECGNFKQPKKEHGYKKAFIKEVKRHFILLNKPNIYQDSDKAWYDLSSKKRRNWLDLEILIKMFPIISFEDTKLLKINIEEDIHNHESICWSISRIKAALILLWISENYKLINAGGDRYDLTGHIVVKQTDPIYEDLKQLMLMYPIICLKNPVLLKIGIHKDILNDKNNKLKLKQIQKALYRFTKQKTYQTLLIENKLRHDLSGCTYPFEPLLIK
ncbi:hypothetical protein CJF42_24005 [Pseudoalteromonas sp. NBT06-2]|uniref:ProQ/FINO family protein n=1 Tax=Pseudoalteromonas sp. NBT06-2 TaxID=2025950 RepID=UPI000BA707B2|nr:ProQ/FINO family protein [Pseudoalteromonas sp. NBT06-2]PAJ71939.1 hypothetical protein CJF42_24005 [Pseudoalteromonas sp. NBT06-2]